MNEAVTPEEWERLLAADASPSRTFFPPLEREVGTRWPIGWSLAGPTEGPGAVLRAAPPDLRFEGRIFTRTFERTEEST